ncbi:Homocysteine S-methyltransferase [Rhexocercosporidium sp. MPI-PUGE-AT-0058]|nr:Homocysteine S-methyltransferase [Rhexocercosporidium sp. MPI-PUGE-AT-0058]
MSTQTPILLLDGGLGTTLADQHGCTFAIGSRLWSSTLLFTDPNTILAVQSAFVEAGADVLLSATYQASFEGFAGTVTNFGEGEEDVDDGIGRGIGEMEAAMFMRSGVGIARKAFASSSRKDEKGRGKVALSLGAYGATMVPSQEYSGKYDEERMTVSGLKEWHLKRLKAFMPSSATGVGGGRSNSLEEQERRKCWADVDLVAFETLPLLEEITAVRAVMGELELEAEGMGKVRKEFWISCVFPGEGMGLPDGSQVRHVAEKMLEVEEGLSVPMGVGINCTKVGKLEALILEFERGIGELVERGEAEWPALVIYPDGTDGEVYNTATKEWVKSEVGNSSGVSWDETVFGIVDRARKRRFWKCIIVGGCCKTTPDDISKLRRRIDQAS